MKNQSIPVLKEISVKYSRRTKNRIKISNSKESQSIARMIYKSTNSNIQLKEYFFIILLDRANQVLGYHKISEGGISGTVADIKLILSTALKCLASGLILVHNHPSGSLKVSKADIMLTQKIKQASKLLDIELLDHIILTKDYYTSFADDGHI